MAYVVSIIIPRKNGTKAGVTADSDNKIANPKTVVNEYRVAGQAELPHAPPSLPFPPTPYSQSLML